MFVQTGDIFDRGARVKDALDLLMRLEDEARRAGGRVEVLLGNHEAMNLLHEFRDVSPAAYATFADARPRRQRAFEDYVRSCRATPDESAPNREEWMASHPQGFVEYVEAIGPRGKYRPLAAVGARSQRRKAAHSCTPASGRSLPGTDDDVDGAGHHHVG